jgi:SEC-C motif-containing protein
MIPCPCGLKKSYLECCGPFHKNEKKPATAEACMRSRYSAYAKSEMEYLKGTHHESKRHEFNLEESSKWAKESEWLGLEIKKTELGQSTDSIGWVEFVASYRQEGQLVTHHERSEFKKVDGQWYFYDGQVLLDPYKRSGPKIGRNDPCSCGSQKKYKKCCGQTVSAE